MIEVSADLRWPRNAPLLEEPPSAAGWGHVARLQGWVVACGLPLTRLSGNSFGNLHVLSISLAGNFLGNLLLLPLAYIAVTCVTTC